VRGLLGGRVSEARRARRILAMRGRLDDLHDELPEILLLADGSGRQALGDQAIEHEDQPEFDAIGGAGRARHPGDGELRGGAGGI
jgi:hypothetical protein